MAGADLATIKKLLGHKTINMTCCAVRSFIERSLKRRRKSFRY